MRGFFSAVFFGFSIGVIAALFLLLLALLTGELCHFPALLDGYHFCQ